MGILLAVDFYSSAIKDGWNKKTIYNKITENYGNEEFKYKLKISIG